MCRSIVRLRDHDDIATDEEIRAAALQFVRKISGYRTPSQRNEEAFNRPSKRSPIARSICSRPWSRVCPDIDTPRSPESTHALAHPHNVRRLTGCAGRLCSAIALTHSTANGVVLTDMHNVNLASPAATVLRMRAPFGAAARGRSVPRYLTAASNRRR